MFRRCTKGVTGIAGGRKVRESVAQCRSTQPFGCFNFTPDPMFSDCTYIVCQVLVVQKVFRWDTLIVTSWRIPYIACYILISLLLAVPCTPPHTWTMHAFSVWCVVCTTWLLLFEFIWISRAYLSGYNLIVFRSVLAVFSLAKTLSASQFCLSEK